MLQYFTIYISFRCAARPWFALRYGTHMYIHINIHTVHCTTLPYTLHCTLHCTLHYTSHYKWHYKWHCKTLLISHYSHYIMLQHIISHDRTLSYVHLTHTRYIALHYLTLHSITPPHITLDTFPTCIIALHYIAVHYITSHHPHITSHYDTRTYYTHPPIHLRMHTRITLHCATLRWISKV